MLSVIITKRKAQDRHVYGPDCGDGFNGYIFVQTCLIVHIKYVKCFIFNYTSTKLWGGK